MEEQLSFNSMIDETKRTYDQIKIILSDNKDYKVELLKYKPSKAKGGDGIASVYVGNVLMCKIYIKTTTKYIMVKSKLKSIIVENKINYAEAKSEPNFIRVFFDKIDNEAITKILNEAFILAFKEYSVESFGCCYRYVECSNAKKCIHPDIEISLGCKYRENLENGNIFYGINKTI